MACSRDASFTLRWSCYRFVTAPRRFTLAGLPITLGYIPLHRWGWGPRSSDGAVARSIVTSAASNAQECNRDSGAVRTNAGRFIIFGIDSRLGQTLVQRVHLLRQPGQVSDDYECPRANENRQAMQNRTLKSAACLVLIARDPSPDDCGS